MSKIRRVGYILSAVLGAGALVSFAWKPLPPSSFKGLTEAQVPLNFGPYHGTPIPVDAETKAAIPSADIIEREYMGPNGEYINATVIGGVGRNQLHDPRSCLVGAGWSIANDHVEHLAGTHGNIPIRNCQASVSTQTVSGDWHQLNNTDIMYVYVVDRRIVASASAIRWTLLFSDLLEQTDRPVYYIRTLTTVPPDSAGPAAKADEHRYLATFTSALWNELSPTIYRGEKA